MVQLAGLQTNRKKSQPLAALPAEPAISRRKNPLLAVPPAELAISRRKNPLLAVPLVGLRINKQLHFQQSPARMLALPEIISYNSDFIDYS